MTPMESERIQQEIDDAMNIGWGGWLAAGVLALSIVAYIAETGVF